MKTRKGEKHMQKRPTISIKRGNIPNKNQLSQSLPAPSNPEPSGEVVEENKFKKCSQCNEEFPLAGLEKYQGLCVKCGKKEDQPPVVEAATPEESEDQDHHYELKNTTNSKKPRKVTDPKVPCPKCGQAYKKETILKWNNQCHNCARKKDPQEAKVTTTTKVKSPTEKIKCTSCNRLLLKKTFDANKGQCGNCRNRQEKKDNPTAPKKVVTKKVEPVKPSQNEDSQESLEAPEEEAEETEETEENPVLPSASVNIKSLEELESVLKGVNDIPVKKNDKSLEHSIGEEIPHLTKSTTTSKPTKSDTFPCKGTCGKEYRKVTLDKNEGKCAKCAKSAMNK